MARNGSTDATPTPSAAHGPQLHVLLGRAAQACTLAFERTTGLHPTRWQILAFLNANAHASQKALARAVSIDAGALTRLLKQMETIGWIERAADERDNRFSKVALTDRGQGEFRRIASLRERFVGEMMNGIADADVQRMTDLLQQIEQNASGIGDASNF